MAACRGRRPRGRGLAQDLVDFGGEHLLVLNHLSRELLERDRAIHCFSVGPTPTRRCHLRDGLFHSGEGVASRCWARSLVGRLLMARLFLSAGIAKLNGFARAGDIASVGLSMPQVGAALAFVVEIVGALALLAGFGTWIAALVLAAFTLLASSQLFLVNRWRVCRPRRRDPRYAPVGRCRSRCACCRPGSCGCCGDRLKCGRGPGYTRPD